MFKKSARFENKKVDTKTVKATLNKCLSHTEVTGRFHSRSMIDEQNDMTLPLNNKITDQVYGSQFALTTKDPLRYISNNTFNQMKTKNNKFNLDKQVNLPNLKKSIQKKNSQSKKRLSTQPNHNVLNLSRIKSNQNKQNIEILQQNRRLKIINIHLQKQNQSLIQTLKKYQDRQKTLTTKIKQSSSCSQHFVIIQSLSTNSSIQKKQLIVSWKRQFSQKVKLLCLIKIKKKSCKWMIAPLNFLHHPQVNVFLYTNLSQLSNNLIYTFRNNKQKQTNSFEYIQRKSLQSDLTIDPNPNYADELLSEIDDCLDSLSRRKRHVT